MFLISVDYSRLVDIFLVLTRFSKGTDNDKNLLLINLIIYIICAYFTKVNANTLKFIVSQIEHDCPDRKLT
jgi:hypothetical protein